VKVVEKFEAKGHPLISAKHPTTLEITKDLEITPRGDCIIAVASQKALSDFSEFFKQLARREDAVITLTLRIGGYAERIVGRGHPNLTYTDSRSIVCRRSSYTCGRTLMIKADKAARDLDRRLVDQLRMGGKVLIEVQVVV